ncbi:NAD-dependent histone deacetylase sir2 [Linnemannia exigua]|uniref:NAD-dependent histone deacetylase sir2 n=1 Tax=Linnemannia exigua TaxID=604196 RepID=A0AAD4DDF7_9FUNG|nr:NAD-dependent histone deacetylase sir2 [Linnemannia exigua]
MSSQQSDPKQGPTRQVAHTAEDTVINTSLRVPSEPQQATSRPESPVNRKRADDHSATGQDSHHLDDGSPNSHSLPPTKKSKTSPPLAPRLDSNYRTSKETISPQTSPLLEPSLPSAASSTSEKRYSPVSNAPTQIKARKLDDDRPLSPSFRPFSPPFGARSPPFRAMSPSLSKSATAILDSLSKPGENSLGNLNLGTPTLNRTPVAERAMGVITSQPGSRQTSPDPLAAKAAVTELALDIIQPEATLLPDTAAVSHVNTLEAMVTSSDDDEHHHSSSHGIEAQLGGAEDDVDDEGGILPGDLASHGAFGYTSGSEADFGSDSMDEIDVENIAMGESDFEAEHEGSPYNDVDPLCEDRMTLEEAEELLEDARMRGMDFVIRKYIESGRYTAKKVLLLTVPDFLDIPDYFSEQDIIDAAADRIRRVLRKRKRLQHIHSLEHVVNLLKTSKRIMVLTGAGVSVSCGIPDFRSKDGIYSRLSEFELDDPQQMFDLDFFRERPEIFYSFAREIFPSNFTPSPSHYFIKLLEDHGKLLRNYTQNIDTLEQKAGIHSVLQCHGSFATASCVRCKNQVQGDEIKESIFKQEVAYCKVCKKPTPPPKARKRSKAKFDFEDDDDDSDEDDEDNRALMKPDIVFFGEKLPQVFDRSLIEDRDQVDLLIVIGSSLKVAPVSDIMHQLPNNVPQILINRTPNNQMDFDVQLLGNCDTIVAELCRMVGWELKHDKLPNGTSNVPDMDKNTNMDGSGTGGRAAWTLKEPNLYLFEGADLEDADFEAIKEKNRRRLLEMHGFAAEDDEGDDDDDDDGDEEEEDEGEHDGEEEGDADEGALGTEDMEGLLTGAASERQSSSREERATSVAMMDEDEDEVEEDSDNTSGGSEDIIRSSAEFTSASAAAATATATEFGAGGAVPTLTEGFLSPRLQPSASATAVRGFASGTTEPRSGSITEIHHDVLSAAGSLAAEYATQHESLVSSAAAGATSAGAKVGHVVTEDKIRTLYTEHMPKDLGEEDIAEFDGSGGATGHAHGNVFLSHSRRPSVDLVPISEDPQLEVDDDTEEEEDVEVEIEIGGPELARGIGAGAGAGLGGGHGGLGGLGGGQ